MFPTMLFKIIFFPENTKLMLQNSMIKVKQYATYLYRRENSVLLTLDWHKLQVQGITNTPVLTLYSSAKDLISP